MKYIAAFFFICLFGWQCAPTPPLHQKSATSVQIIFVPGYYGSTLTRESDDKKIWFTGGEALWGDQTLALDRDGLGIPEATAFKVGEVLRSVDFLGPILSKDIYGGIVDDLQARFAGRATVVPFAYDWRGDIAHSARQLARQVEDLYAAGASRVAILAHSMGGLVTSYYLLYGNQELQNARLDLSGAQRIHAVAMAGVPFEGTLAVFRNMQQGIQFGLNAKALEGLAVASFPSSYQILPKYPKALATLEAKDVSGWIHDAKRWNDGNWGLLQDTATIDTVIRENRTRYTENMLSQAQAFYRKLRAPPLNAKSDLPFLLLYGNTTPTVAGALWDEKKRTLLFSEENIEKSAPNFDVSQFLTPGDGTVTIQAAQPPESLTTLFPGLKIKTREQEHLDLLKDGKNLNEIVKFLEDALKLSENPN